MQFHMYKCLHFVPIVAYSTAASSPSSSSFFPNKLRTIVQDSMNHWWVPNFVFELKFVMRSCFGSVSHHFVRAYKRLCQFCVKYTLHPVSPPLSVSWCFNVSFVFYRHVFFQVRPNVCMLVVLVIKFGRRKVVACRNTFKVNISIFNTTHSRIIAIRFGMVRFIVNL